MRDMTVIEERWWRRFKRCLHEAPRSVEVIVTYSLTYVALNGTLLAALGEVGPGGALAFRMDAQPDGWASCPSKPLVPYSEGH